MLDDFRASGREAVGLRDEGPIEVPDDVALVLIRRERSLLLTRDKGIGDVHA